MTDNIPNEEEIPYSDVIKILKKKNKSQRDLQIQDLKFAKIKFFAEFRDKIDEESFYRLQKSQQYEKIGAHQQLFRKGDRGEKFYILLKGSVSVMLDMPENEINKKLTFQERRMFQKMFHEHIDAERNTTVSQLQTFSNMKKARQTMSTAYMFVHGGKNPKNKSHILKKNCINNVLPNVLAQGIDGLIRYAGSEANQRKRNIIEEADEDNILNDMDDMVQPRMKMSRPMIKLAYILITKMNDELKTNTTQRLGLDLPMDLFWEFKSVCYWENKLLKSVSNELTMDIILKQFPRWKQVLNIQEGGSFGEIALLQKCTRKASIYCSVDCEFAAISKKGEGDFEFQIRWESRQVENFLKSFKMFNYFSQKNQLGVLTHYITKQNKKIIGDFIYKTGQKVKNIYFLKSGEVELNLIHKPEPKFQLKDETLVINEKVSFNPEKQIFRRNLKPKNVFGVEEILADIPTRIFEAKIKTSTCCYFELPKEKIFLDLVSKYPTFQSYLLQYSCLTNETLAHGYEFKELSHLKKRSYNTCKKDARQLILQLEHQAIQEKKNMIMMKKKGSQTQRHNKKGDVSDINDEDFEKISEEEPKGLSVQHADQIMKNMTHRTKKFNKFYVTFEHLENFNKQTPYSRGLALEKVMDELELNTGFRPQGITDTNTYMQGKIQTNNDAQSGKALKKTYRHSVSERKLHEIELNKTMPKESLLDYRVNLHRYMANISAKKCKGKTGQKEDFENKIKDTGFKVKTRDNYQANKMFSERSSSIPNSKTTKMFDSKKKSFQVSSTKPQGTNQKKSDEKAQTNTGGDHSTLQSVDLYRSLTSAKNHIILQARTSEVDKSYYDMQNMLKTEADNTPKTNSDKPMPYAFDESWKSNIYTQLKTLCNQNIYKNYDVNLNYELKNDQKKIGLGVKLDKKFASFDEGNKNDLHKSPVIRNHTERQSNFQPIFDKRKTIQHRLSKPNFLTSFEMNDQVFNGDGKSGGKKKLKHLKQEMCLSHSSIKGNSEFDLLRKKSETINESKIVGSYSNRDNPVVSNFDG